MTQDDLAVLQEWFADPILNQGVDGDNLPRQFACMQSELNYWAWIACEGDRPVGFVWFEIQEDGIGNESLGIQPDLRNRGYGSAMLRALIETPEAQQASCVAAHIDPKNTASIRCHEKVGFVCESDEPDEEGFLRFVHR